MIYIAIASILLLTIICLWLLIERRKSGLTVFVLTPLLIFSLLSVWGAYESLKGYATEIYPNDKDRLLHAEERKPYIYLLVSNNKEPRLHQIPWSKEMSENINKAMKKAEKGQIMMIERQIDEDVEKIIFYEFDLQEEVQK